MLQLRGYEPNAKGYFAAIQAEDIAGIRTFFQADFDPNTVNEKGDTPLTFAVLHCEPKTINVLLEKADINQRDKSGNTPTYLALLRRREAIFKLLMKNNPDVNVPGNRNNTLLHLVTTRNDFDLVQTLVDRGANVNAVEDETGSIPLIEACIAFGRSRSHIETVEYFIEKGADINQQSKLGNTCLIVAAREGQAETVAALLKAGANTDLKDRDGLTALQLARKGNHTETVKILTSRKPQ